MSIISPELEVFEAGNRSIRYLQHGWPSQLCRWHSHAEYELHLILSSRGKAFVGDYIGNFEAGCLYLVGPNLPHNWVTDETYIEPIAERDMVILFKHERLEQLMKGFSEFRDFSTLLELAQSGVEFFNFDFEYAKEEFAALRDMQGPEQVLRFLSFLHKLNAHQDRKTLSVVKLNQVEANSIKHTKIGEIVDLIVENCTQDLSLAKASSMSGMSETSFSRNFQLVTGNRFIEFINRVRIGQACVMLFETEEQVSSICYDVGFQNLANFNRHFLKMKNMTPSEYRDHARSNLSPNAQRPEEVVL